MTAATGAGIWLGITCGSLAIIHVLSPHLVFAATGAFCSLLFLASTLEAPRQETKAARKPQPARPAPARPKPKTITRDLEGN